MRGRWIYFYALKEDFLENIKELENKLGGLKYAKHITYKEPKIKVYNSIEELCNIGKIIEDKNNSQWIYFIAKKEEEFSIEKIERLKGGYNYYVEDEKGFLKFQPSGIYIGTNCIIKGELSTVSEDNSRQNIFKEMKKALLKNMMLPWKNAPEYVGKSVIENKEKYRLPYAKPESDPEWDYDISDVEWKKK